MVGTQAVLWDFDGTLATRPGLWSACVVEVLDAHVPAHAVTRPQVAESLRSGFPWHRWDVVHADLCDPDDWWAPVLALVADAIIGAGAAPQVASTAVVEFREAFLDPSRWQVYPDSVEALKLSASAGWRNVIVSNHVPELPDLVDSLGLGDHVHDVLTSGRHGYEKPHPGAFRLALEAAGRPTTVWMVGDNPIADIAGAAQLGIPGILTRAPELGPGSVERLETSYGAARFPGWQQYCEKRAATAAEAVQLILSNTA